MRELRDYKQLEIFIATDSEFMLSLFMTELDTPLDFNDCNGSKYYFKAVGNPAFNEIMYVSHEPEDTDLFKSHQDAQRDFGDPRASLDCCLPSSNFKDFMTMKGIFDFLKQNIIPFYVMAYGNDFSEEFVYGWDVNQEEYSLDVYDLIPELVE